MKAATELADSGIAVTSISIHAAREGGDLLRCYNKSIKRISIHAAREGGDTLTLNGKEE